MAVCALAIPKMYEGKPEETFCKDLWKERFERASRDKSDGRSDLIYYWGLPKGEDVGKIERIVPINPYSREPLA